MQKTNNFEKTFDEMLMRMDNLEKNISKLIKQKSKTRELREASTSFNSWNDQAEERISEVEDKLNEIKWEDKIRKKKDKKEWAKSPRNVGLCEKT